MIKHQSDASILFPTFLCPKEEFHIDFVYKEKSYISLQ